MLGCFDSDKHYWSIFLDDNLSYSWEKMALDAKNELVTLEKSPKSFDRLLGCIEDAKVNGGMTCEPGLKSDLVM